MEKFPEIKKSFQDIYGDKEFPKKDVNISDPNLEQKLKDGGEVVVEKSLENLGFKKEDLSEKRYNDLVKENAERIKESGDDLEFTNNLLEEEISQRRELEKESEMARQKLDELLGELNLAKIDLTTGMKLKRYFFAETIPKVLGENFLEETSNEQWLELFENDSEGILEKLYPTTIVMIDVSYLNLANRAGHHHGDKLLKDFSGQIQEDKITSGNTHRMGGDEFAIIFKTTQEAESKMELLKEKFSQIEMPNLRREGLDPNIDFGGASFGEAVEVFREILKIDSAKERISKGNVFKEFVKVWEIIADKKSIIEKAQTRIPVLMEHYQLGHNSSGEIIIRDYADRYDWLFGYLGKGGYEITKEKLAELVRESGEGSNIYKRDEWVHKFILEKEQRKLLVDNPPYDRLRDSVIARKIGVINEGDYQHLINKIVEKLEKEEKELIKQS